MSAFKVNVISIFYGMKGCGCRERRMVTMVNVMDAVVKFKFYQLHFLMGAACCHYVVSKLASFGLSLILKAVPRHVSKLQVVNLHVIICLEHCIKLYIGKL